MSDFSSSESVRMQRRRACAHHCLQEDHLSKLVGLGRLRHYVERLQGAHLSSAVTSTEQSATVYVALRTHEAPARAIWQVPRARGRASATDEGRSFEILQNEIRSTYFSARGRSSMHRRHLGDTSHAP